MDTEDASNIKRFVSNGSPEEGGGRYQVYSARLSAKRHVIAVGTYENIKITTPEDLILAEEILKRR